MTKEELLEIAKICKLDVGCAACPFNNSSKPCDSLFVDAIIELFEETERLHKDDATSAIEQRITELEQQVRFLRFEIDVLSEECDDTYIFTELTAKKLGVDFTESSKENKAITQRAMENIKTKYDRQRRNK